MLFLFLNYMKSFSTKLFDILRERYRLVPKMYIYANSNFNKINDELRNSLILTSFYIALTVNRFFSVCVRALKDYWVYSFEQLEK
jgi:hypothetical protein